MSAADGWRPVVGYEGIYEVTADGQVRSLARTAPGGTVVTQVILGCELRGSINQDGYLVVTLRRPGGIRKVARVHRLVAQAFLPAVAGKPCINHLDNDRANNRVSNLEWCTQAENLAHMTLQGRRAVRQPGFRSRKAA